MRITADQSAKDQVSPSQVIEIDKRLTMIANHIKTQYYIRKRLVRSIHGYDHGAIIF